MSVHGLVAPAAPNSGGKPTFSSYPYMSRNYAPGLIAQKLAADNNCQQNLWIFGDDDKITEVGTMNFFAFIKTKGGGNLQGCLPLNL